MNATAILWPMLAQVLLVYVIYWLLASRRTSAVKAGSAKASQFRENRDEPAESLFIRNNLTNQFELPVLFYAASLALLAANLTDLVTVTLAWLFVASRVVHAWVHVTTNRVRYRRPLFITGFMILGLMWLWLALRLAGLV